MAITYFPVTGNWAGFPQGSALNGSVTFTPNIPVGSVALDTGAIPPLGEVSASTQAVIVNGVLLASPSGGTVELLSNTADLNLDGALQYLVSFGPIVVDGQPVPMGGFAFDAPTDATGVNLITVTPAGVTSLNWVPQMPVSGLSDATPYSRGFLTGADNQADARVYLGIAGGGGDWEEYANLASFPVTGNTTLEYLALDTNNLYRWNGSAYVLVARLVLSTEITDSSATGRAVLTGDPAAGRAALGMPVYMPAPSGDITGVTDSANLVTAQAKLPAGVGAIIWGSGTYWLTGNNDIPGQQHWYGQGISATTLRLARQQSVNLIRTKNFETYKCSDTVKTFGVSATYVTATISSATSTFLSNVITAASTTGAAVGDIMVASGFNPGTYITAVTATSITVSGYCNFGTTGTLTVTCSGLPTQFGFHDLTLDGNGEIGGQSLNKINPPVGLTVTPTGTTGSTTYLYRITGVNAVGETQGSQPVTITNGNASLSVSNYNALSWTALTGATSYNVYAGLGSDEHWVANVSGATTYNHQTALFASALIGQVSPMSNTTAGRVLAVCGYGWSMSNVAIKNGGALGMDVQLSGGGGAFPFASDYSCHFTDVHVMGNDGGGVRIIGQTDSYWCGAGFIANGITGGSASTNGLTNLDVQAAGWSITDFHFWGGGVQTGVRVYGQWTMFTAGQFEDGHDYLVQILGRGTTIENCIFYNSASNNAACVAFYDNAVYTTIKATLRDVRGGILQLGVASNGVLPTTPTSDYDFTVIYEIFAAPSPLLIGALDPSVKYVLRLNNRLSGNTLVTTTQGHWLLRTVAKTANYTVGANEFVEADATSGALTMTLPTAPPHGTRCGGKKMDGTSTVPGNAVSFATGGSDKFNTTAGGTTFSLSQANQAFTVQYDSSTSCWVVISTDFPKGVADALYEAKANKDAASGYAGLNASSQLTKDTLGNAATATKWATARNVDGQSVDGSGDVTVIAPGTHAATGKTTPVDADELPLVDSAAANVLKKLTWANLKATVKTYYDSVTSTLTNKDLSSGTNTFPAFRLRSVVSVTTSTTLGAVANTDYVALIGSGGTPTLPTAVGSTGRYVLKNVDSAAHSVLTTSSQTIEGVTTYSLAAGDSIEVISDTSNWKVI